jgi:trehalose/maltose hydrolase-like predicted phosphorylase
VFGFCGLKIGEDGELALDPHLPNHWREVAFSVNYRGRRHQLSVKNE